MTASPHNFQPDNAAALRLLAAEDDRQSKLHELLETIREQIRLGVPPEHRPEGLFKNIQDAVYAMRGRTALLNDAAITACFAAPEPVAMTGTVHKLKTWPEYFNEVLSGRKPFEWRVDDRDFKLGDTLVLQEYIPHPENPGREGKYTGREITKAVSYIFSPWPTNKRTVVMAFAQFPPSGGDRVLIQQLREMATDFAIDNKTNCKQHVCWIAADRLTSMLSLEGRGGAT